MEREKRHLPLTYFASGFSYNEYRKRVNLLYEIYIDVLFLENLILDYLILNLVKRLLQCSTTKIRIGLAALLGSLSFCVFVIFALEETILGSFFLYVPVSISMAALGFGIRSKKILAKATSMLYGCTIFFGGMFLWVQSHIEIPVYSFLFFTTISYIGTSRAIYWIRGVLGKEHTIYDVTILYKKQTIKVKALWDTGNLLWDPLYKKPLHIIENQALRKIVEEFTKEITYNSVGKQAGKMKVFLADYCKVEMEDGIRLIRKPALGIAMESLSSTKKYDMILNPKEWEK